MSTNSQAAAAVSPAAEIQPFPKMAHGLAFTRDGQELITTGMEPVVKVWRTSDWSLARDVTAHGNAVTAARLLRGDTLLVTCSSDNTAKVWSYPGLETLRTLSGHKKTVTDATLSPDGKTLATTSYDARVHLYDLDSGALDKVLKGHAKNGTNLRFSPDGAFLASGALGAEVIVWSPGDGTLVKRLGGHATVTSVLGWSDGALMTLDYEGVLREWEVDTWLLRRVIPLEIPAPAGSSFAPNTPLWAVSAPHTIAFFDTRTWERLETLALKVKGIYGLAWSPDGSLLANSAADGRVRIWRTADLQLPRTATT